MELNLTISDMHYDLYLEESYIVVADSYRIRTLNTLTLEFYDIAGEYGITGYQNGNATQAKFSNVVAFIQPCQSIILVLDSDNHCIRLVDRDSNDTSVFAGICTQAGFHDGALEEARFDSPSDMVLGPNSAVYYVADSRNSAIREVNAATRNVSTLLRTLSTAMRLSVSWDRALYYTDGLTLHQMNTTTRLHRTLQLATNSSAKRNDNSSMISSLCDMLVLPHEVIVSSESAEGRLRIINAQEMNSSTVCNGSRGLIDGDVESCQMADPCQLLLGRDGKSLLIGTSQGIRKLQIQGMSQP